MKRYYHVINNIFKKNINQNKNKKRIKNVKILHDLALKKRLDCMPTRGTKFLVCLLPEVIFLVPLGSNLIK